MAFPRAPASPELLTGADGLPGVDVERLHVGVPGGDRVRPGDDLDQPRACPCLARVDLDRPAVAASTGVPHGTEKSVPVCQLLQWLPVPPQLWLSVPMNAGGTG